jgi:precorrin-6A/cobalt-precorrin-6A reductase
VRLLVLGGTADARTLAAELHGRPDCEAVYALAGRTSQPSLPPGRVRVGGFGGADGLADYLRAERIDTVIDATHPFAPQISEHAAQATRTADVRLIALRRRPWTARPGDQWTHVPDLPEAARRAAAFPDDACVFITTGRQGLEHYAADTRHPYVIRTVDPPVGPIPPRHTVVLDRGPYTVDAESELMERYDVRLLVTKNSGGSAVAAKLASARDRGIPVIMIDPPAPPTAELASSVSEVLALLDGI